VGWQDAVAGSFFFFQAEEGIRAWSVTGVQTCALPICLEVVQPLPALAVGKRDVEQDEVRPLGPRGLQPGGPGPRRDEAGAERLRSEERRVGKEGRSGGSPRG